MTKTTTLALATSVRVSSPGFAPYFLCEFSSGQVGNLRWSKRDASHSGAVVREKVLIVDDEELIADTVVEILNRNGYDAIARYSGASAIRCVEEECPPIVVSDVIMPDCNGIQLAKSVRLHCPATRILLFSGNAATARLLHDSSGDGHSYELLPKPIHPVELLKALQS
jgi:DNA-binding NtrC family response regulator